MSDNDNNTSAAAGDSAFTEREIQILAWAMRSLKSGPPEVDYDKLAGFAGMKNPRSASNAWAKIKAKLTAPDGDSAPATPKKGRKKADAAENEDGTPKEKATPRKRGPKKQDVDGEASPKKRGRPSKKAVSEEANNVKTEADETKDLEPVEDAPVKTEGDIDAEVDAEVDDEV